MFHKCLCIYTGYRSIIHIDKDFMITQFDSNIDFFWIQENPEKNMPRIDPIHMGRFNFTWKVCLSYLIKVLVYITWITNSTFLSNKDITIGY